MSIARRNRIALTAVCILSLAAAGACTEQADPPPAQAQAMQALSCPPLSTRPCPCLNGGIGTQSCLPSGAGYTECINCPPPAAGSMAPGPMAGAAAVGGAGNSAGVAGGGLEAGASAVDAGASIPDASSDASQGLGLGLSHGGPAPGVSCGVGLPVLCKLESQKCCVRSLRTDTCIEATDSCECDLPGCSVMAAECDGPEDCPQDQVCCGTLGTFGGSTGYERFECATGCDYAGTQRMACHQDQENTCPGNNVCANSQLLTNLQICIDPATIEQ